MTVMRVVVFASGRGSNARALFEAARLNPKSVIIEALICNRPDAGVLSIAEEYGIRQFVIPVERQDTRMQTRLHHEERIHSVLRSLNPTLICLAGYMRIMTPEFIRRYPHPEFPVSKIVNIHPSLLPSFKGSNGYRDAFEYNVKVSGITVHFVNEDVDGGLIIDQRSFPRRATDDLETFKSRGLILEHKMYPEVLLALAQKDYSIQLDPFSIHLNF